LACGLDLETTRIARDEPITRLPPPYSMQISILALSCFDSYRSLKLGIFTNRM
jgi:hypothetical protein